MHAVMISLGFCARLLGLMIEKFTLKVIENESSLTPSYKD